MSIQPFIKCSQIKASLAFYTETLDFKVVQAPDPDPDSFMSVYAFLERDGGFVHLSEHSGDGVFGNIIYVKVEGIEDLYENFVSNGLKKQDRAGLAMELVTQTWGMKEFAVVDPDGNRIRFGQRSA